jgi:hypothetical protein
MLHVGGGDLHLARVRSRSGEAAERKQKNRDAETSVQHESHLDLCL